MSLPITLSNIRSLSTKEAQIELLLSGLNKGQREAVLVGEGPCAVIAGAGSGKTTVLTRRTCLMLHQGIPATQLLLVTFTNKGAGEIVERLQVMVGEEAQHIAAGTFHSLIFRHILKANVEHPYLLGTNLNMAECTILDETEAKSIFEEAIKSLDEQSQGVIEEHGFDKVIQGEMAAARARGLTPEMYGREKIGYGDVNDVLYRLTVDVWNHYSALCRAANGIDFDDIMVTALALMKKDPAVGQALSQKFRYIMLDEYQDTNPVQDAIIDEIAKHHRNLFVVGDEKQSIYGFRGSDISIILGFTKRYKEAKLVELDFNYRSTAPILEAANCVAKNMHSTQRVTDGQLQKGKVYTGNPAKVSIVEFKTAQEEAEVLAQAIKRDMARGVKGKDIAVLYRKRASKVLIEAELVKQGIDYQIVGDVGFYQRAEVKNGIALLRMTFRPWDHMAILRVLQNTSFGVSDASAKKAIAKEKITAHAYLTSLASKTRGTKGLLSAVAQKVAPLLESMKLIRQLVACNEDAEYIHQSTLRLWDVYMGSKLKKAAEKDKGAVDEAVESRMGNVKMLFNRFFDELKKGRQPEDILDELSLLIDRKQKTERELEKMVILATLHASKGLEFPHVYLPAMDEDNTPGLGGERDPTFEEVEEERRLTYVGITRAMVKLGISYSKYKVKFGKGTHTKASPFIRELSRGTNNPVFKYPGQSLSGPSR
ncbi:ATP-dependent helicase (plasmid) [Pseudomonas silesiensis]|uniref:ATP-dependent helicase n=1 Tax=Pseudomonas silesiensis TaxID=1853130 RepID=UPI0030D19A35